MESMQRLIETDSWKLALIIGIEAACESIEAWDVWYTGDAWEIMDNDLTREENLNTLFGDDWWEIEPPGWVINTRLYAHWRGLKLALEYIERKEHGRH